MTALPAGEAVDAAALPLAVEPVPDDQVAAGAPSTGWLSLGQFSGSEVGMWEMTPGAMADDEVDEVFVVIAGSATVEFVRPSLPSIDLVPGTVVRLEAGMRTAWTVRETLRKVVVL